MTPEEFVVLDANVWIKERLFRSAVGVAFLNIISRTSLWIGLPEIVRRELLAGVVRLGNDAVNKIAPNLATIQMIVGEKPPYHLPEPQGFESAVNMRLAELAHHIVPFETSEFAVEAALARVIGHRPPSHGKE